MGRRPPLGAWLHLLVAREVYFSGMLSYIPLVRVVASLHR
jgi:hypothetical protein